MCLPSLVFPDWSVLRFCLVFCLDGSQTTLLHSVQEAGEHLGRVIMQESTELKEERHHLESEKNQAGQQTYPDVFCVHCIRDFGGR